MPCAAYAGYVAGWTTECFGEISRSSSLTFSGEPICGREICCATKGAQSCTFLFARPEDYDIIVENYSKKLGWTKKPIDYENSKISEQELSQIYKDEEGSKKKAFTMNKLKSLLHGSSYEVSDNTHQACEEAEEKLYNELTCEPLTGKVTFMKRPKVPYVMMRLKTTEEWKYYSTTYDYSPVLAHRVAFKQWYNSSQRTGKKDVQNISSTNTYLRMMLLGNHFGRTGLGKLIVIPEVHPTKSKTAEGVRIRCQLLHSIEAEKWLSVDDKERIRVPGQPQWAGRPPSCCNMSGYISGWMSENFGEDLECVEVECQVSQDDHCTFLVSRSSDMESYIDGHLAIISKPDRKNNLLGTWIHRTPKVSAPVLADSTADFSFGGDGERQDNIALLYLIKRQQNTVELLSLLWRARDRGRYRQTHQQLSLFCADSTTTDVCAEQDRNHKLLSFSSLLGEVFESKHKQVFGCADRTVKEKPRRGKRERERQRLYLGRLAMSFILDSLSHTFIVLLLSEEKETDTQVRADVRRLALCGSHGLHPSCIMSRNIITRP
ncbi:hypothetical protein PROFUN_04841 [Planoprotostelium fungivorum]|uniref:4-vinyl reductase 4VR domain-containing protein n=1 Tax=Planoprotostelium fungivorum TaxID=1890364 RepID=A0A2P6NT09_9EUKA|nr:hypothetical protein PROFUN_04841 [Planoprotostelium fungivorum]